MTAVPSTGPGNEQTEAVEQCGAQVATRLGIATCNDHGAFGHHDTRLLLSWPDGDGRFITEADR